MYVEACQRMNGSGGCEGCEILNIVVGKIQIEGNTSEDAIEKIAQRVAGRYCPGAVDDGYGHNAVVSLEMPQPLKKKLMEVIALDVTKVYRIVAIDKATGWSTYPDSVQRLADVLANQPDALSQLKLYLSSNQIRKDFLVKE